MRKLTILLLAAAAGSPAAAHEGHGHVDAATLLHYVAEPLHAGPLLIAVIAAVVWLRRTQRSDAARRR